MRVIVLSMIFVSLNCLASMPQPSFYASESLFDTRNLQDGQPRVWHEGVCDSRGRIDLIALAVIMATKGEQKKLAQYKQQAGISNNDLRSPLNYVVNR